MKHTELSARDSTCRTGNRRNLFAGKLALLHDSSMRLHTRANLFKSVHTTRFIRLLISQGHRNAGWHCLPGILIESLLEVASPADCAKRDCRTLFSMSWAKVVEWGCGELFSSAVPEST